MCQRCMHSDFNYFFYYSSHWLTFLHHHCHYPKQASLMCGLPQWLPELSVASFQSIMHKTERIFFPKCKPDCTTLLFKIVQWFDTALRKKVLTDPIKSSFHISIQSYFYILFRMS